MLYTRGDEIADDVQAIASHPAGGFVAAVMRYDSIVGGDIVYTGSDVAVVDRWSRTFRIWSLQGVPGGALPLQVRGLVTDDQGNVIVFGHSYSTVTFFAESGANDQDLPYYMPDKPSAFIAAYSATGDLLFARTLATETTAITDATFIDDGALPRVFFAGTYTMPGLLDPLPPLAIGTGSPNQYLVDAPANTSGAFVGALTLDTTQPAPITGWSATSTGGGNVDLSWDALGDGGATKIRVLRKAGTPPGNAGDAAATLVYEGTATSVTDTVAPADVGTLQYYRAYRVDAARRYRPTAVLEVTP